MSNRINNKKMSKRKRFRLKQEQEKKNKLLYECNFRHNGMDHTLLSTTDEIDENTTIIPIRVPSDAEIIEKYGQEVFDFMKKYVESRRPYQHWVDHPQ